MSYEDFKGKVDEFPFPVCTVDVIIEIGGSIVLISRKYPPYGWALPGGFVEKGESLEQAALREASEETGLVLSDLRQFRAYSEPDRDSRFHSVSVVFTAVSDGVPEAASDAKETGVFGFGELPEDIAFDHRKIIADFIRTRQK
jgi:ADP-ribose pyrophosphatase YjhB (NUDIX family)